MPSMDLHRDCLLYGRLPEPVAQVVMWQTVRAARHCCRRGVLHHDIKPMNILINTDTLEVKLINFGCGKLLTSMTYTKYKGQFRVAMWIKSKCGEFFI